VLSLAVLCAPTHSGAPMTDARSREVRLFGPFRFDIGEQRLFKEGKEIRLRRKPFAILRYLTEYPQRLVTQEELFDVVWGKLGMSDSVLRTHVCDVRRAVGEGVVETVIGRGYRFLHAVETERPPPVPRASEPVAPHSAPSHLVGRKAEINVLVQAFEAALDQKRQLVFVTGDPGIGKTALVDAFLTEFAAPRGALIASGLCVEHLVAAEAYLPVLAALGVLCRGDAGRHFADLLTRHAPTWRAQMPGLVDDDELQSLAQRTQGATQARMLRELAEVLDVIAAERPLVLVLEDVQWADASTTDLLAMLGARREPARILVVATCRPSEIMKGDGMSRLIAELRAHKQATVLGLETWSEATTGEYLARRFAAARFPEDLAPCIHRMTGGNPLFAAAVVDDLESRGMIRPSGDGWELAASVADVAKRRPDTVRQLIDIQIDRLKPDEQGVLEAASLVGVQFPAGAVAFALDLAAGEVDSLCEGLASHKGLLRFVASEPWPDGSVQSHYSFAHALYRDAALSRVPTGTRRMWHRRIADGLEHAHGAAVDSIATELAVHYDEARVGAKAVRYYGLAAERAMRRFGRAEALAQFGRAHALMATLPASDESDRTELAVLKQMGPAMIALQGTQAPQLEHIFARTAELARKVSDDSGLFRALLGLQRCHFLRGQLADIERYEGELAEVVARLGDPAYAAIATVLASSARLFRGQLVAARRPLTDASAVLYAVENDAERMAHAPLAGLWGVHLVMLSWLGGAPDAAMAAAVKMRAWVETLRDPLRLFWLSMALTATALAHVWRREPRRALEAAHRAMNVSPGGGSPLWQARAMTIHHWAATVLEPETAQARFEELLPALAVQLGAGPGGRTAFTPCVVGVYAAAGHHDRALKELDDALAFVERTEERAWSSELHRLRGEILKESDKAEAERAMKRALEVSREQGAKSFELRAALSLAKLDRGPKKNRGALEELRRCFASFTEGFGTGDLVEVKALLDAGR
jgi:DNA-binding winged helix-turn-helix (wHTH) protein/tetratricopeptide (TPR) repeat protein